MAAHLSEHAARLRSWLWSSAASRVPPYRARGSWRGRRLDGRVCMDRSDVGDSRRSRRCCVARGVHARTPTERANELAASNCDSMCAVDRSCCGRHRRGRRRLHSLFAVHRRTERARASVSGFVRQSSRTHRTRRQRCDMASAEPARVEAEVAALQGWSRSAVRVSGST